MTIIDPGYSEAGAHIFTWLADKVLGGTKKALDWGWSQAQWARAQDRYDEQIIKQYGEVRVFGQTAPKSLKDIFTDVFVLDQPTAFRRYDSKALTRHLWEGDRSVSFRDKERRSGEQLLNEGSKFFILGKPGAGKTTFLKYLAVREAQRGRWGQCLGKLPIFVSLKQFAETGKPLFDFIVDEFAICHFPDASQFVENLLKSGQALVLFDGLDEVSKSEVEDRRGQITEILAQFARQYSDCHIVITCRIAAVEYTFHHVFTYLEIADFAPIQVEAFVRAWFWDESDKDKGVTLGRGMLEQWARPEHAGIRDLGRNPLLLTLVCLNYAETLSFPTRRVEIYEEALDALLKKWDTSRRIERGGLYKTLSLGRKRQMFARIAFDALVRNEIVFPQAFLERWLIEYMVNVPELPQAIDIDGEAVLRQIVAQHGIFTEQAHGLFSFAHLTFQEYYAARYIADNMTSGALDRLLSHIADDKWREVFLLSASLLPDATMFLTSFEGALQRLIVGRPQLAPWLRWIDALATKSLASYRRPATRLFYARALAPVRSRAINRAIDGNLAYALDRALDLDSNLTHALDLVRDFEHPPDYYVGRRHDFDQEITAFWNRVSDLTTARYRILDLCKRQGRTDLHAAIFAVAMPDTMEDLNAWMGNAWVRYAAELGRIIESRGALTRYRRLEAEVAELKKRESERWSLDDADFDALINYTKATWLFYNCLQVAYTPDRRSFEERMFLPPP